MLQKLVSGLPHNGLKFYCPACKAPHRIQAGPNGFYWNGDTQKPTVSPSIFFQTFKPCTLDDTKDVAYICHSWVADGKISFLPESTHTMAGQTHELPFKYSPEGV